MGKFKVGDRVKRIDGTNNGMVEGDVGIVVVCDEQVTDLKEYGKGHTTANLELIEEAPSEDVDKMTTKKVYSVLIFDKKTGETIKDVNVKADNEQEAILKTFNVDAENTFIKIEELGSYQEDKPKKVIIENCEKSKAEKPKK